MTASLELDSKRSSRRALLTGALGGLGALVATAIGRPNAVRGGVDGDVVLGQGNNASSTTAIANITSDQNGFEASATGTGTALVASANNGQGLYITSWLTGVTVFAQIESAFYGSSGAAKATIVAESINDNTAIQGSSGNGALPPPKPKTGVYGYAAQDANAVGVYGKTLTGRGVTGEASSGIGMRALATNGTGMYATATTGVALRATGRVLLDNCSGIATIPSGSSGVVVTPGIDLLATSAAVATIQGNPAGSAVVKAVAVDATANTLTIRLTANASTTLKVAWHVFG